MDYHILNIVCKWVGCLGVLLWFGITKSDFAFSLGVIVSVMSIANSAVSMRKNIRDDKRIKVKNLKPKK